MGMYDNPAFKDTTAVTTHNIHSKGDGFHVSHQDVYNLVQHEVRRTREMTNLHAQLHRIYAGNLDYHTTAFTNNFNHFVQLMPKYSDATVTGGGTLNAPNKKVHMRTKDHHLCLNRGNCANETHTALAVGCKDAYISDEKTENACSASHTPLTTSDNITSRMASMAEYYDKPSIGVAKKGEQSYPAIDGFEGDNIGTKASFDNSLIVKKTNNFSWFGSASEDAVGGTGANPNDLFYYTKVEYTNSPTGVPAGLSTTAEHAFADQNNEIFQNYAIAGGNCDTGYNNPITLQQAGKQVSNTCLGGADVGKMISEFPKGKPDAGTGTYYHWGNSSKAENKTNITSPASAPLTYSTGDQDKFLMYNSSKAFQKVDGKVILKHAKILTSVSNDFVNTNLPVPSGGENAEFIQIYKTSGTAGNPGPDKAYFVSGILGANDFMKNNFAFDGTGTGTGTTPTINLYARLKKINPGTADSDEACKSVSNSNTTHDVQLYDDKHGLSLQPASDIQNDVTGQGTNPKSKLCEFGKQMDIPGKYMLAIARVLQYQMKFTARELYLLNLYQYGTVVKIDKGTNPATAVSPIDEKKCKDVIKFGEGVQYVHKTDAQSIDCPTRYIVLPKAPAKAAVASSEIVVIGDVDGEITNGAPVPTSSFVLVEYTEPNLNKQALKDIYSGRPLVTLSHQKYRDIQTELLTNYKLVGHDIDELNKIAVLQEDTKVLGNKNYYMVMIYTVVLFFLLGTIYMISK